MAQDNNPKFSSFLDIKKNLDPESSYLIFEKTIKPQKNEKIEDLHAMLSQFKSGILDHNIHQDVEKNRLYLVVKIDPNTTEEIIDGMITIKLPKDITFYIYSRSQKY